MKTTKKLFAVLLSLAMVLALGLTAFALVPSTGSITVKNPAADTTYTAYKIFDATYTDTDDHTVTDGNYSYTIAADADAYTAVEAYAATTNSGLKLTLNSQGTYTVTFDKNKFSAAAFAQYLKTNCADNLGTGTALTAQGDGTVKADKLDLGYYFVSSNNGTICNLATVKDAVIYDKNDTPDIEKTVNDADKTVDVGQKLTFTLTGKVPSTTGYTTYTYQISDKMTNGLTFDGTNTVNVTLGDTAITTSGNVTIAPTYTDRVVDGFTATIDVMKYQDKIGADIVITYTATVNESAITRNIETNTVTLTYSNNPTDEGSKGTAEDKVDLYSFNIDIDKYKSDDETVKLTGAKFVLKKTVEGAAKYYKYDEPTKTVSWVDTKADATEVVTDTDGAAAFNGLEAGTYALEETEAPEGFNPLTEDIEVVITKTENGDGTVTKSATVDGDTVTVDENNSLSLTAKVANSTGAILPETGGIGTMIFVVIGMLAVLGAGIFLVTNKRMSKESV